jgi:hypothetical protein
MMWLIVSASDMREDPSALEVGDIGQCLSLQVPTDRVNLNQVPTFPLLLTQRDVHDISIVCAQQWR